jgi:hypothetical protein
VPRLALVAATVIALLAFAPAAAVADPVIAAAGDIACPPSNANYNGGAGTATACRQKYTSDVLVNGNFTTILPLGDNQYDAGELSNYQTAYGSSWGRVKPVTRPVPGNHEPGDASGYFDYFNGVGASSGPAGERGKGYYSYDVGRWHLIALNSNCAQVACAVGSAQEQWLRDDLAAHPAGCKLAYFHHPRFSSGHDGDNTFVQPLWQALYDAHVDLALSGHSHDYERFAPQDASGNADNSQGIRQFVVGTGGAFFTGLGTPHPNSEVRNNNTYGVLSLTLHPASYDWQFVPEAGGGFTDAGSALCHRYEFPASASPIQTSLVPSFKECGTRANSADGQHSPPLGTSSCNPPEPTSPSARTGSAGEGSASITVRDTPTTDLLLNVSDSDIQAAAGTDYDPTPVEVGGVGKDLSAVFRIRFTDQNSCSPSSCSGPYTEAGSGTDTDFGPVPIDCVPNGNPTAPPGSDCNVATTANTLLPGSVVTGKQTVVQVFRIRVDDATDHLFQQQGYYVP